MLEKRKLKRRHLIYYLRVFDRNTNVLMGHLVDIASEGILLIGEHSIETDQIYQLKMVLPAEILGKEQLLFDAKCVRCQKDINSDFFNIGFQLEKVSRNHFFVIEQLIDDLGFRD
ncbi:MAG: PilZ domain-containing protein [Deltaproteobacteria bacterium]|nr:PilZ domain-containing protein [Deltaproteobacteria bacterium]